VLVLLLDAEFDGVAEFDENEEDDGAAEVMDGEEEVGVAEEEVL
jgi:hypothetical protein